jgi:hypothetical protein
MKVARLGYLGVELIDYSAERYHGRAHHVRRRASQAGNCHGEEVLQRKTEGKIAAARKGKEDENINIRRSKQGTSSFVSIQRAMKET